MFIRINAHGHLCIVCTVDHVIVNTDFLSTYNPITPYGVFLTISGGAYQNQNSISLRAKSRALYSYYDNEKKSLKGA